MTDLQKAIRIFRNRTQFNDDSLLLDVIEAVRNEERKKFEALVAAAKTITDEITTKIG